MLPEERKLRCQMEDEKEDSQITKPNGAGMLIIEAYDLHADLDFPHEN